MPELAPSRTERNGRIAAYLTAIQIGVVLLVVPPAAVTDSMLGIVAFVVAIFLIVSGSVMAVAAYFYAYLVEYVCLVSTACAVATCALTLLGWSWVHDGTGLFTASVLQMLFALLIARFGGLRRLVKFGKRGDG